jgi:transaldolase
VNDGPPGAVIFLGTVAVKLFVDSADPEEIAACVASKGTSGVVTSGSRLLEAARGDRDGMQALLRQICGAANGPVGIELAADGADRDALLREARAWAEVAAGVVVMLPDSPAGIEALRACTAERIRAGVARCTRPEPALAAARAGAVWVSAAVGRVDGVDGYDVIRKLVALFRTCDVGAQVLAGAIRAATDVLDAAIAGAHVAVAPGAVVRALDAESTRQADRRG